MSEDLQILNKCHPRLARVIQTKFKNFTPIQREAIPAILDKNNIIAVAPTAGGKTEAALWPVLSNILHNDTSVRTIRAIMIAPLKALLNDLDDRVGDWTEACGLNHFKWHGDVKPGAKQKALKEYPDILLTTPESLEVLFVSKKGNPKEIFTNVESIIIDEAHYFAADARGAQLVSLIERIEEISKYDVQRIGLSATVGNPEHILTWFSGQSCLESKVVRGIGTKREAINRLNYVNPDQEDFEEKYQIILAELAQVGKSIFFNNSRKGAELIAKELEEIHIPSEVHHGSLSKFLREEAELNMKKKEHCVISATSTLELGIDIGNLDRIIQCDNLPSVNSYLQRLGRTGRRHRSPNPTLASLVHNEEDFLLNLAIITKGNEGYSEPLRPSSKRYDILFQQLLSAIVADYGVDVDLFWNIIKKARCFEGITEDEYHTLLDYWVSNDWLNLERRLASLGLKGEKLFAPKNFLKIYSVFQTSVHFEVIYQGQQIGILDAWFVYSLQNKFKFRLGGCNWRVEMIDEDRNLLHVEKTGESLPPYWGGGGNFTVEYPVAQRMREIISNNYTPNFIDGEELKLLNRMRKHSDFVPVPENRFCLIKKDNNILIYTYAGSMINEVLKFWFTKLYSDWEISSTYTYVSVTTLDADSTPVENALKQILAFTRKGVSKKDWFSIFEGDGKIGEFSKFSEFLPMEFKVQYMINGFYDFHEFQEIFSQYELE